MNTTGKTQALAYPHGFQGGLGVGLKAIMSNKYVLYCISISSFLLFWHWAAINSHIAKFLPTPMEVISEMIRLSSQKLAGKTLWGHLWASLRRVLIGFSLATAIGIPIGILMAMSNHLNRIIKPLFDLLKPMPPISWISLAILWFGIGEGSKIFIIAVGAFVPAVINAYNGIRLVDPALYDAIRMLGGNRRTELLEVTFPASFPAIFAGLQIALSMAWGSVVAAELVGARAGMGFLIILGMNVSKPAMIIGGMIIIAMVAGLLALVMTKVEKRICPWKRELTL